MLRIPREILVQMRKGKDTKAKNTFGKYLFESKLNFGVKIMKGRIGQENILYTFIIIII